MCPRRRTAPQKPGLEQRSSCRGVRVRDAGQQLGGAKAALRFPGVRTQQKPDSRPGKRLLDLPGRRTPPSRPPVCLCAAQPIGHLHILIRHHSTSTYLLGHPVELRVSVVLGVAWSESLEGKASPSGQRAPLATRDEIKAPGWVSFPWKRVQGSEEFPLGGPELAVLAVAAEALPNGGHMQLL